MLFTPLVAMFSGLDPQPIDVFEQRKSIPKPDLSKLPYLQWSQSIEDYLSDNLGFRSHMIALYMNLWELGLNTNVRYFVKGKDDELFPNFDLAPTVERYLGLKHISRKKIVRFQLITAGTQAFWELHGVKCLMVMAPDKTSVYPELLPSFLSQLDQKSMAEQIDEALRNTPVNFINLKEAIDRNKKTVKYFNKRFDIVHWNGYGLEVAYQEIFKALAVMMPNLEPKPKDSLYAIVPYEEAKAGFGQEMTPWMKLHHTEDFEVLPNEFTSNQKSPWAKPDFIRNPNIADGKILLLTDSYLKGTHMHKLPGTNGGISPLVHNFHEYLHMHYASMNLTKMNQTLRDFKPDTVVYIFAERVAPSAPIIDRNSHYLQFLGELYLNNNSVRLTSAKAILKSNHPIQTMHSRLIMVAKHNDPQIHLAPIRTDENGRVALLAKLVAPADTYAQLFFAQGDEAFSESRSVRQKIDKGINYLHLPVHGKPRAKMKLRLDPGVESGRYIFLPITEITDLRPADHGF